MKQLHTFLIMLLFLFNVLGYGSSEKYIIGTRGCGFFSCFFEVLHGLEWCQRSNKIPVVYWDTISRYYCPNGWNGVKDNVWEYYFEPVSDVAYQPNDVINRLYEAPDGKMQVLNWQEEIPPLNWNNKEHRRNIKATVIDPYIVIKQPVQDKIEKFYQDNMYGKKTIGLQLRGTDNRCKKLIPLLLQISQSYVALGYQFYIATDQEDALLSAKKILRTRVISYSSFRSNNNRPVHGYDKAPDGPSKASMGEDVLIESQLLSRCDLLIHPFSNVSIAALFFNPELPNIYISFNGKIYQQE